MAAYCAVPPGDPFAVSRGMFDGLAAGLAGPAAAVLTACELEELLDEKGRDVLRQLLQDHFDLRAAREERQAREDRAPATGPGGITRTRLENGHARLLATLFGTVKVTRCAWRKPGTGNWRPADAALSLPAGRHSHSLAKLAALEAARGSFGAARDAVTRRCGPVIGKRQLEQAVTGAAADIPAFYAARIPEPCTAETLLVLSADCKGIVMRPGALRAATAKAAARLGKMRTRLTAGEKPNRKRMAALVAVCDAEPARRRPHDVIAPPGGRHGWHYSVVKSGLAIAPGPATAAVFAVSAGRIRARFGRLLPAMAGTLCMAVMAGYWMLFTGSAPDYPAALLPGLIAGGVSAGLTQAPLFAAAGTLPPDRATTGSAVLNMARQVGNAVGVAVVVVILGTSATHTVTDFHHVWAAEALAGLVACLSIAVTAGHGARTRPRSA